MRRRPVLNWTRKRPLTFQRIQPSLVPKVEITWQSGLGVQTSNAERKEIWEAAATIPTPITLLDRGSQRADGRDIITATRAKPRIMDLTTTYLGMKLRTPLVPSSITASDCRSCHLILAQGGAEALEQINAKGRDFIGIDAPYAEFSGVNCHTGEP
jgi:hypothetical protein